MNNAILFGDARLPARFWDKADVDESGCWTWKASRTGDGYGKFYWEGQCKAAHRIAYRVTVGEVPPRLDLDHLCRNRACVNPAHLEPVPHIVNLARGVNVGVNKLRWSGPRSGSLYSGMCARGHDLGAPGSILTAGRKAPTCAECRRTTSRNRYAESKRVAQAATPR